MKTRLDDGAAIVLSAMLEATRSEEMKVKIGNSGDMTSLMIAKWPSAPFPSMLLVLVTYIRFLSLYFIRNNETYI